mmetsp:Transcript_15259/g.38601  ORF Transcript_15259/g.38601 Transcript_15259/m.38601 type:complete len:321 (-) Transcript_15259:14-976(-)
MSFVEFANEASVKQAVEGAGGAFSVGGKPVEVKLPTTGPRAQWWEESKKLFIVGLPKDEMLQPQPIQEYVEQFGAVESVDVKINRNTGLSKGFAIVEFKHEAHAAECLLAAEHRICDRRVTIIRAKREDGCWPQGRQKGGVWDAWGSAPRVSTGVRFPPTRCQLFDDRKLFVGGVSLSLRDEQLTRYFESFGHVEQCSTKHGVDGASRGFAIVQFADVTSAGAVLSHPVAHCVDGCVLNVQRCKAQKQSNPSHSGTTSAIAKPRTAPPAPPESAPTWSAYRAARESWEQNCWSASSWGSPWDGGWGVAGGARIQIKSAPY